MSLNVIELPFSVVSGADAYCPSVGLSFTVCTAAIGFLIEFFGRSFIFYVILCFLKIILRHLTVVVFNLLYLSISEI